MEINVIDEYNIKGTVTVIEEAPGGYTLTYEKQPAGILAIHDENYEYHGELSDEVIEQVVTYLSNH